MLKALAIIVLFPMFGIVIFLLKGLTIPSLDQVLEVVMIGYLLMTPPAALLAAFEPLVQSAFVLMVLGFFLAIGMTMLAGPKLFGLREWLEFSAIGAAASLMCWFVTNPTRRRERGM